MSHNPSAIAIVEAFIAKNRLGNLATIQIDPEDPSRIILSLHPQALRYNAITGHTSQRQLKYLKSSLADLGLTLTWILLDTSELEAQLQELSRHLEFALRQRFGSIIEATYVTGSHYLPRQVSIVLAGGSASPTLHAEVRSFCESLLSLLQLRINEISVTQSDESLNPARVLRLIKISSPVTFEDLLLQVSETDDHASTRRNLSRQLDRLRKEGLILRLESASYSLTLKGLRALGSSTKRTSADIARGLAIARRSW